MEKIPSNKMWVFIGVLQLPSGLPISNAFGLVAGFLWGGILCNEE
jgi:hypothetical protein